jgi:hypothetical protein
MIITVTPGSHVYFKVDPGSTVEFDMTGWGQTLVDDQDHTRHIRGQVESKQQTHRYLAFNASTQPMNIQISSAV